MVVACAACGTQLEVDESLIPPEGGVTHCAHCQAEVPLQRPALVTSAESAAEHIEHDFVPGPELELANDLFDVKAADFKATDLPVATDFPAATDFPVVQSTMDFDLGPAPSPPLSRPAAIAQDYGASELMDTDEPEFVEVDEFVPNFTGSLSTDGSVEKPPLPRPSSMAGFPTMPEPDLEIASGRAVSKAAHERTTVRTDNNQATGHPRFSFWAFSVILIALFVTSGLIFRAGGLHRLLPQQAAVADLELEHLALVPYVSQQGRFFWLVKADVRRSSDSDNGDRRLDIHVADETPVTATPGVALDPLKLYVHGSIATLMPDPPPVAGQASPLIAALMPHSATAPSLAELQINHVAALPGHTNPNH